MKLEPAFRHGLRLVGAWSIPLLSMGLLLVVVWQSRALRPIQDDYDMALYALDGPLGGTLLRYTDWSGDVWTNLVNVVLVGLPLLHLPSEAGSSVAFLAAALAAVLPILTVASLRRGAGSLWFGILLIPPMLVSWWAWWWINAEALWHSYAESDALTTTFWQNVNATYVIAPLLLLAAWLFVDKRTKLNGAVSAIAFGLIGLGVGLTGVVFATASLLTLGLVAAAIWMREPQKLTKRRKWGWSLSALGVTVGVAISMLSPGSRSRSETFLFPEVTASSLQNEGWWMANTAVSWLQGIVSPGTAVTVSFLAIVVIVTRVKSGEGTTRFLLEIAAGLLLLSFVIALMNALSEFVVYKGYWHLHTSRAVGFVALALLGVAIGSRLMVNRHASRERAPLLFLGIVLFLVVSAANFSMVERILIRLPVWEVGPAPVMAINDIEDPFVRPLARRLWNEIGGLERGLQVVDPLEVQ